MRDSQSDASVLFANADCTVHTGLHKMIVTDNNLKYNVVSVTESDHGWASKLFSVVNT
jgi:hypothetical protein